MIRHPVERVVTGDILDPKTLTQNHSALAGEWSGGADRENLPAGFGVKDFILPNQFNKFEVDPYEVSGATNRFDVVPDRRDWQWSSNGVTLGLIEVDVTQDEAWVVEWSGWWDWSNGLVATVGTGDAVRFRILVDEVVVAISGPSYFSRSKDSTYLVGAAPVAPGVRTARVEALNAFYDNRTGSSGTHSYYQPGGLAVETCYVQDRELILHRRVR